jgi:hypothetical protein
MTTSIRFHHAQPCLHKTILAKPGANHCTLTSGWSPVSYRMLCLAPPAAGPGDSGSMGPNRRRRGGPARREAVRHCGTQ